MRIWSSLPVTPTLLNSVDTDEHEQRLTHTRGVIEAQCRQAARLREDLSLKPRLVH